MKKPRAPSKASIRRAADRAEGKLKELGTEDIVSMEPIDAPTIGRPSSFKPEYIDQARKLCAAGHTDQEVADFFEISVPTLSNWKSKYPEFLAVLKNSKDISDERVERSLYHRAIGYTFESEEIFQHQGEIIRAKVRKHIPPDTTAAIFWLKNRRRDLWRDVQRHEIGRAGEFEKLSDTDLLRELAQTAQLLLTDQTDKEDE